MTTLCGRARRCPAGGLASRSGAVRPYVYLRLRAHVPHSHTGVASCAVSGQTREQWCNALHIVVNGKRPRRSTGRRLSCTEAACDTQRTLSNKLTACNAERATSTTTNCKRIDGQLAVSFGGTHSLRAHSTSDADASAPESGAMRAGMVQQHCGARAVHHTHRAAGAPPEKRISRVGWSAQQYTPLRCPAALRAQPPLSECSGA